MIQLHMGHGPFFFILLVDDLTDYFKLLIFFMINSNFKNV